MAIASCGDDEPSSSGSYFDVNTYGKAVCDQRNGLLDGRRELRLFTNGEVDLGSHTRGLQRYYRRYGLQFFTTSPVGQVQYGYALDTNLVGLEIALKKEFPDVDLNDEAALMADMPLYNRIVTFTENYLLGPIIEFAKTNGTAGTGVTNLVVLPHMVRPDGDDILPEGAIVGLSVSPSLLAAISTEPIPEAQIWKGIQLPAGFSPMMFLDGGGIAKASAVDPLLRDMIMAHEFGHTGALIHRDKPDNVMKSRVEVGRSNCSDGFDEDQIATLRATLGVGPVVPSTLRVEEGVADSDGEAQVRSQKRAASWFPPSRLGPLLRGDRAALREFLAPLVSPIR